jgi:hypothetical protein
MCAVAPCTGLRRSAISGAVIVGLALAAASGCASGSGGGQSGSGGGGAATGGSPSGGQTGAGGGGFGGSGATAGSGTGGTVSTGGTGGSVSTGGTIGTGGSISTGGLSGTGGSGTGGSGGGAGTGQGGASVGGSTGGQAATGAGGQAGTSTGGQAGATAVGNIDEFYEAEAIPPNQIFGYAKVEKGTPVCTKPLTVGASCFSGGGEVTWIVSKNGAHPAGWMQFNAISAPADASYDVTFWYHCGLSDVYGDCDCGGQAMIEPKQTGCRPHVFTVNGTALPGAYHFACFPGSWSTLYAATVSLPLTKGMNTVMVSAPDPRDASDIDVIEILPPGKGHDPLIAPNTKDPLGHGACPPF